MNILGVPRIVSKMKQQIVPKGNGVKKIRSGLFRGLKMRIDLTCQTQLYLGLFEREVYKYVRILSRSIKTAIDIGAADGEYTIFFLAKTPARKVISFEPEPRKKGILEENLKLNQLLEDSRLRISTKYVGGRDSICECSLDSLISDISWPCLIKVDVEGGEAEILRGAEKLLTHAHVYWLIETHSKCLEAQCIEILKQSGFTTKVISQAWWRLFVPELRVRTSLENHNRWLTAFKDLK